MQPQRDCLAKRRKVSREEDPIHCARHCIGCFLKKDEGRKKLKTGTFRPCAPRFQCFKIACVLRSQRASVHEGTDDAVQCRSAMLLPILETEKKEPKAEHPMALREKNKHSGSVWAEISGGSSDPTDTKEVGCVGRRDLIDRLLRMWIDAWPVDNSESF